MNKKILISIILIACLFIVTVIVAVIFTGRPESKAPVASFQPKKPANVITESGEGPVAGLTESVPGENEKEFEPPIKGPLLN